MMPPRDVNYPVASCFRLPKIEHAAMVAGPPDFPHLTEEWYPAHNKSVPDLRRGTLIEQPPPGSLLMKSAHVDPNTVIFVKTV